MRPTLKRLWCRHEFYWSERHQTERCRKCGNWATQPADISKTPPPPTPRSATVLEPVTPIVPPPVQKPEPDVLDVSNAGDAAVETGAAGARPPRPTTRVPAGAGARREVLLSHFTRLASGEELARLEVLDLVMGLLEDAHVHNPVIFGPEAASRFADLHQASVGEWLNWPEPERRSA
ncbi:hypothetical protein BrevBR_04885 [Brevundimonas sp. BR2-1]|uniref:hypothetical protein n=1 Tax=Brevundimonas sp. BR2-1 TaxID=3031123 RepID=UPI0030B3A680